VKKITLANYRQDRYYARTVKATEDLLRERGFVAPVDLFVRMELLSAESVEDWHRWHPGKRYDAAQHMTKDSTDCR